MSGLSAPGLVGQSSFGQSLTASFGKNTGMFGNTQTQQMNSQSGQGMFGAQSSTGVGFGGMNTSVNPLGGNSSVQAPGQLASSPSFGTINPSIQPQIGAFGQQTNPLQQSSLIGQNQPNTTITNQTNPLQFNPTAPNSQSNPNPQPQQSANTLDQNIK